jgi:hypothetical protein
MDKRVVDYGSFVVAAIIFAITQYAPQINQYFANDPTKSLIVGIVLLFVSQLGSYFAVKQAEGEVPAGYVPEEVEADPEIMA